VHVRVRGELPEDLLPLFLGQPPEVDLVVPEHLRRACEGSLARLRLDRIDLYQFHRPDPHVPIAESIGALAELKDEGKIRHIGVSNVTEAERVIAIVSVQNRYNVADRSSEPMLDLCDQEMVVFIPWAPIEETEPSPRSWPRPGGTA